jgi:hypothetical protein
VLVALVLSNKSRVLRVSLPVKQAQRGKQVKKSQHGERNSIPLSATELFRNITDVIRRYCCELNEEIIVIRIITIKKATPKHAAKTFFIRRLQLVSENSMTRATRSPQPSNLLYVRSLENDTKNNASVTMLFLSSFHPDEAFFSLPQPPGELLSFISVRVAALFLVES